MKSVRIRSFSGTYSPAFGLYLSVFSPNAGEYGPEKIRTRVLFTEGFSEISATFEYDYYVCLVAVLLKGVIQNQLMCSIEY